MLYLWRRLDEERRQRVWQLYGWYSALMTCGSCIGIATWWAWMQRLSFTFIQVTKTDMADRYSIRSLGQSWRAVFSVTYVRRLPLFVFVTVWSGTPLNSCALARLSS